MLSLDFNKDGQSDLGVLDSAGEVTFFPGVIDGTFLTDTGTITSVPLGDPLISSLVDHGPGTALVGDFNEDGSVDQVGLILESGDGTVKHCSRFFC